MPRPRFLRGSRGLSRCDGWSEGEKLRSQQRGGRWRELRSRKLQGEADTGSGMATSEAWRRMGRCGIGAGYWRRQEERLVWASVERKTRLVYLIRKKPRGL